MGLKRNAAYHIVGLQSMWGKDEANVMRGMVVEHQIKEELVRFFVGNDNDFIQQHHLMGNFYGEPELTLIGKHFSGGTFIDVGANVGNHSLYALRFLNAQKVIAFEPNPPAFKILQYNVLLNGLRDRADLRPVGLSNQAGTASIAHSPDRNLGGTRLEAAADGRLTLMRGDDALAGEQVSFIKIDVESLEMQVLEGLRETIRLNRPPMYIEVDPTNEVAFRTFIADCDYEISDSIGNDENTNFLVVPTSGCA